MAGGGFATSIVVFAVGAVLRFALTVSTYQHGFNVHAIGVILMIVGAVGAVVTLALLSTRRRTDVTYRNAAVPGQGGVPVDPRYSSATYVEPAPLDPRI